MPNLEENRETFGSSGNQHSKTGKVWALVSGMYDILNRLSLHRVKANRTEGVVRLTHVWLIPKNKKPADMRQKNHGEAEK